MRAAIATLTMFSLFFVFGCGDPADILNRIMLEPDPQIAFTPADLGFEYEDISVPVTADRSIRIWYVPTMQPKALLVVIPGAADNRSFYARLALPLIGNSGYDIILSTTCIVPSEGMGFPRS